MYLHYADMIANGYHRTMPCPFQSQGLLLNPNGDLHYCENSQKLGNVLDASAESLYFAAENLAHRDQFEDRRLPHLPQPVPGQRRRHEAVRAVREVPEARLPGQASPRAAPRHAADNLDRGLASIPRPSHRRCRRPDGDHPVERRPARCLPHDGAGRPAVDPRGGAPRVRRPRADGVALDGSPVRADAGVPSAVPAVLRTFFVSTFVGSFLPSIGGDAYRAYSLSRHDVRLAESAASVLMDRVLGVLAIAFVGAARRRAEPRSRRRTGDRVARWPVPPPAVPSWRPRSSAIAPRRWRRLLPRGCPWRAAQRAGISLTEAMRRYSNHHVELVRVLLASAGVQAIRVVQAYCLGRALAHRRAARHLLPPHPDRAARHAAADHGQRTRHEPGRVSVSVRPGGRTPRRRPWPSPFSSSRSASSATCRAASSTRSTPIGPSRPAGSDGELTCAAGGSKTMKRVVLAAAVLALSTFAGALVRGSIARAPVHRPLRACRASGRAARHRSLRPSPPRGLDRRSATRIWPDAARHLAGD